MEVYKFGGASVRNAKAVKNLVQIIKNTNPKRLIIVISAMGKTTNGFEELLRLYRDQDVSHEAQMHQIKQYHLEIIEDLGLAMNKPLLEFVNSQFREVQQYLDSLNMNPEEQYDQVVSIGEVLSTKIIAAFLSTHFDNCTWLDARSLIKTNDAFTEASVDWSATEALMQSLQKEPNQISITQGFIGSTADGRTTTLGREGSDFSAAIFAYCLDAEKLTIWKDVPGILNADPKIMPGAVLIRDLSYEEAAEMTYYGAKVIHPKTIRPLARKAIPLYVQSFQRFRKPGTLISTKKITKDTPIFIYNFDQLLISLRKREFTFIDEKNLSFIFQVLDNQNVKINLMQNSATTFSFCMDYKLRKLEALLSQLSEEFEIHYNESLTLLTIKNYSDLLIHHHTDEHHVLLEQKTRKTFQALYATTENF